MHYRYRINKISRISVTHGHGHIKIVNKNCWSSRCLFYVETWSLYFLFSKINCNTFAWIYILHIYWQQHIWYFQSTGENYNTTSNKFYYFISTIYFATATIVFDRRFIFFMRNIITGSVFWNKTIITSANEALINI